MNDGNLISETITKYSKLINNALNDLIKSTLLEYRYAVVILPKGIGKFLYNVVGYNDFEEAKQRALFENGAGSCVHAQIYERKVDIEK